MDQAFELERLVRPSVLEMEPYSSARDEFAQRSDSLTFLDANESPYENGLNRYPDPGQKALKEVLSQLKGVPESQLLLGNGSDEVLDLIFRAFCRPGRDNVITLPPTYGMYEVLARLNEVENRRVGLNRNFEPDLEAIFEQVDADTKLLFLCSPNNPSGNLIPREKMEILLQKFKGLVIVDEAYIEFAEDPGYLPRLKEFPNLMVTQTLSKAYGLAGLRLGMCWASKEIIDLLHKIKPPYNINTLSQERAIEQLQNREVVQEQIQRTLLERSRLIKELGKLNFVRNIYASRANFLLVAVDDARQRYHQLIQNGMVVRNRSGVFRCENCLRFSVGRPEENTRLLAVMKAIDQVGLT